MAEIQVRSLDDDAPKVVIKSDKQEETPQEPIQEQAEAQSEEQPQSEEVNEVSSEETQEAPEVQEQVETPTLQIDDESALNYLKEKYKFEGDSLDVLLNNGEEKQQIELTSDVQAFLDYQKETGRGLNDFLELNKDFDSMDDMSLMRAYLKETKPHYDDDDISYHIQKKFVAQDDDAEDYRREKALDYKDELYKARQFFNTQKEKYHKPLESSDLNVPQQYKDALNFYSEYQTNQEKQDRLASERNKVFLEKTDSLFNQIEGFEFDMGDNRTQTFKINDKEAAKKQTTDITDFVSGFLDSEGFVKDTVGYHKAMYAASNPDLLARHFYELGRADAVDGLVKETKNIDMTVQQNPAKGDGTGPKFRAIDADSGTGLKIKKRN